MKNFSKLLLIITLLLSCNDNTKKVRIYDSEGDIESIETIYKDSIRHGEYQIFFKNGNISQEGKYYYGNVQGEVKFYYETGELNSKINFQRHKKFGNATVFYKNGLINSFLYYGANEEVLYRMDFSEDGELIKENGCVFLNKAIINDTLFNLGDTFSAKIEFVNPEKISIYINIFVELNNEIIYSKTEGFESDKIYIFETELKEKGHYKIGFIYNSSCGNLMIEESRTNIINIEVIN